MGLMAGRPRSFDRDLALETALEHFWREGYDHTTVATLTRAMGITPPSLYAAFGDKDELFAEAAACYCSRTEAAIGVALSHPDIATALAELLRGTARAHADAATPPGCLALTEPRLGEARERLGELIATRLQRAAADGQLVPAADPQSLAHLLMAVMSGMSARARDGASLAELTAVGELALGAFAPWLAAS